MLERKFLLDEDVISEVLKKEEKSRTREGDRMDIAEIQKKVGHDSKGIGSDEGKFQLSRAIFVKSAMIYKNHGKSDEEITAMLEKDFMLNEDQIKLIMDEIADCNDSKKDS